MTEREQIAARFWPNVDVRGPDEHWLWTKGVHIKGYGQFRGRPLGTLTHRIAFMLWHGVDLPPSVDVHHQCRVKLCCNPHHLQARDAVEHRRMHLNEVLTRYGGSGATVPFRPHVKA